MNSQDLLTVKQLVEETPALTENQIRWFIFHKDKYNFGHVTVKIGRRVLLDRSEFSRWLGERRQAPLPCANENSL